MQLGFLDTTTLKPQRPRARSTSIFRSLRNVAACALGFAVISGVVFGHNTLNIDLPGLPTGSGVLSGHNTLEIDVQVLGASLGVVVGLVLWAKRGL